MDDLKVDPDLVNAVPDEFTLGSVLSSAEEFGAPPVSNRPPWLVNGPPKKRPFRWPGGAKSPSWFRLIAQCPKRHANRYRRKMQDPSGVDAFIGIVIHGACEDAIACRLTPGNRRKVPSTVSTDELLCLLEFQPEAIRQGGEVLTGDDSYSFVTTEVMSRAREIVKAMKPLDLTNVWATEYIWNFWASPSLRIGGVADMIQVTPASFPNSPPREVVITDFKTGASQMPSQQQLELDPQACMELCWGRRQWPHTPRVRFRILNVNTNSEIWIDWNQELDERTLSFARAAHTQWNAKLEDENVGGHCKYCPFRENCRGYQKYLRGATYQSFKDPDGLSFAQLAAEYRQAKTLMDLAETRKKDLSKRLLELMGNQKNHRTGRYLVLQKTRRTPAFRSEYELLTKLAPLVAATGTTLEVLIDTVSGIKKGKLDAWIKSLPKDLQTQVKAMVDMHQSLNESAPWIEVSDKEPLF